MSKMPMIFAGHGSPMNAIEDNRYTREWREMAKKIPRPESIVSISAHWYTEGTKIMNEENPKTVYDMYGFPDELYKISYNAPGNPGLAGNVKDMISKQSVYDNTWGIDHGTWSVLTHMYPQRDIPVFQISIDAFAPPQVHYQIGRELKSLRDILHYMSQGESAKLAVPAPDHFNPSLYLLGASDEEDKITVYNNSCMLGSLSMTSYLFE